MVRFWLLIYLLSYNAYGLEEKKLAQGESVLVNFSYGSKVHISRKGVIDLTKVGERQWRITALKKGLVMISEKSSGDITPRQILIRVASVGRKGRDQLFEDGFFLRFVCQRPAINCSKDEARITGTAESWSWYWKAKEMCQDSYHCIFDVKLTKVGLKKWQRHVTDLLSDWFILKFFPDGRAIAIGNCKINNLKYWTDWVQKVLMVSKKFKGVSVACENILVPRQFKLEAKAFVVTNSRNSKIGVPPLRTFLNMVHGRFTDNALNGDLVSAEYEVVGEPVLYISGGEQGTIESGIEIPHITNTENGSLEWKKTGFTLTFTLVPRKMRRVDLTYKLELSSPTAPSNRSSVQVSLMKGKTNIRIGEPSLIGELNTASINASEASIPVLGDIPIVGPVFRLSGTGRGEVKLYLSCEVTEL